uniref:RRM domain-containing protein n=1 Tax=Hyaloperonospora arabidopsidis (strain Emoy2) TaxID=559515 RepID=M4BUJ2_HYAAE
MDADIERIKRAHAKNLAYIQQQDEREASQAVDDLLAPAVFTKSSINPLKGTKGNSSVYITGLSMYMACRQLEGVCSRIGKVRRIKFYRDERGGLKGDAVVTFNSRATMIKAVDRLNHFEVKPGVIITATEATFSSKKVKDAQESEETVGDHLGAAAASMEDSLAEDVPPLHLPSRSVTLKHVWNPLDSSNTAFFTELEEDMRGECAKHGVVEHVQIVADGSVIVRFAELKSAIACMKVMNGRWFAGSKIEARFDQTTVENPSDADTKVEAFLASIGE